MTVAAAGRRRGLAVLLVAGALALASSAGVARADDIPTNWWYDYYGVGDVHAQGLTGQGVKVGVIDAQINSSLPVFQGTQLQVHSQSYCGGDASTTAVTEPSTHGTEVTALWIGNGRGAAATQGIAPGADLTFYALGSENCSGTSMVDGVEVSGFGAALHQAVQDGNRIVQTSQGFHELTPGDISEVASALRHGIVLVVAEPNSSTDASQFPQNLNGVVSVGAYGQSGSLESDAADSSKVVVWPEVTVVAPGVDFPSTGLASTGSWDTLSRATGASLSAPLVGGILALAWQKYPSATGNQLIQSLIRNTTTKDHALSRDTTGGFGYGPASLRHVLAEDPTQYPDTNPLMDKSFGKPTAAQVSGGSSTTASPSAVRSVSPAAAGSGSGGLVVLVVVVAVLALLVLAGVVVLLVLVLGGRRMRQNGGR